MPKKKIKLKKRLYNMWTHLRNPTPLLVVSLGMGLIIALFILAFPCGKYGHPVHGVCDDGSPFYNPLHWFIGGAFATLLLELIQTSSFKNDTSFKSGKVNIINSLSGYFQRWPKWRRKWYPIAFVISYTLMAVFLYIPDRDGGLHWYHYAGQFFVVIPFLATLPADRVVNWARKTFKIK